jgi:hypothetical protein
VCKNGVDCATKAVVPSQLSVGRWERCGNRPGKIRWARAARYTLGRGGRVSRNVARWFGCVVVGAVALAVAGACGGGSTAPPSGSETALPTTAPPPPVIEPTPTATLAAAPEEAPPPATGVAVVDAVISALHRGDGAALVALVAYRTEACVLEQRQIGAPALCPDGVPEGTPVRVLSSGSCEGYSIRRTNCPRASLSSPQSVPRCTPSPCPHRETRRRTSECPR